MLGPIFECGPVCGTDNREWICGLEPIFECEMLCWVRFLSVERSDGTEICMWSPDFGPLIDW